MTSDEFDRFCKDICPHCKQGRTLRQRDDTYEFVHDFASGPVDPRIGRPTGMGHAFCLATHFRIKHKDSLSG